MEKKNLETEFHMTGGTGKTSYANNSSLQKQASDKAKHITIETVREACMAIAPKSLGIADLGCSSGSNTLSTIKYIIKAVDETNREILGQPLPEFRVFLNDLPSNDFNSIFKALPDFHRQLKIEHNGKCPLVFVAGFPGSFYGRLFPDNTLHFVYSSYSLHWLSKVPPDIYDEQGKSINKGCIYISSSSPEAVSKAYYRQFKEDFSLFLQSRSKELVAGGRMVLILLGREGPDHVDRGNSFFWELLSRSVASLIAQGKIKEEKLNSYDVHFYAPTATEIEGEVKREGSFTLDRLETLQVESETGGNEIASGEAVAMTVRAIQESMLRQHFGEDILDSLFETYGGLVDKEMAKEEIRPITFVIVLRKL